MPWTALLPAWLVIVGCYSPDLSPGRFRCTISTECPDGQVCTAGRCADPTADLAAPSDAAQPPVDQARPQDQAQPDLATGPMTVAGCAQQGYALSEQVFACPGAFTAGQARTLCKAGHHLCGDVTADGNRLSAARVCPAGFYALSTVAFAGRVTGGGPPRNLLSCKQMPAELKPALAGCSQETGATVFQAAETDCNGFSLPAIIRSAVICAEQAGGPWTCTDTLDSATHRPGDATQGGVLCCKD